MENKKVDINSVVESQFANAYKGDQPTNPDEKGNRDSAGADQNRSAVNDGRLKNKTQNKQKTFYISDAIIARLRKMAYERNLDQSFIVRKALEDYFDKEGY